MLGMPKIWSRGQKAFSLAFQNPHCRPQNPKVQDWSHHIAKHELCVSRFAEHLRQLPFPRMRLVNPKASRFLTILEIFCSGVCVRELLAYVTSAPLANQWVRDGRPHSRRRHTEKIRNR